MKHIIALIIFSFLFSCIEDNNVSDIPSISYESLEFKKSDNSFNQDSLIITINFIDGDGNLGLTHGLNGIRNTAKNKIQEQAGGRKDYKIDCIAAEFKDWEVSWK